jgi:PAS domain S-box-containing protein
MNETIADNEPVNILIVDDEPKNLTVLETVLDDPSYRLVRANSADEALLALVGEEFALLILDIRMPGMTGFELALMIKERKKTAGVPIIFLTAYYNEDQHVLEGYGVGAVDYLHKPINPTILRSKVAVFVDLHRKNREIGVANRSLIAEVIKRRQAQEQLRELNETLEQRVTERTEELSAAGVAIKEAGERYRSLFENSLDAIISLNTEGRFEDANPSALRLCGYTLEQLKLKHFLDLSPPDQKESAKDALQATFQHQSIKIDTAIITATNQRRELAVSSAPAIVGGKLAGVLFIGHDVTERKHLLQELKEKNVELEIARAVADKANQAKSAFLSNLSHELRSPLNAILGFAQLMDSETPPPSPTQKGSIDQILRAGWYLLQLINEILDLAVVESGKISMSMEPVSLAEVALECQAMIEPLGQKRGIHVTFPEFGTPYFVEADRIRLKQVLINLLSNAIKYNKPRGSVDVHCELLTSGRVRISVTDTGAGLTQEKMEQLFQPFNRLGQESSGEEGTGIGLTMCKLLVELMGGDIGVESTVGVGSTFWFELNATTPRVTDSKPELLVIPQTQVQSSGKLRTLLYVEDNAANLQLVARLVARQADMRLLSAGNGNLGVELARGHQPDIILMDINLPGISGLQALKILREDPETAHIPVIAISANAMLSDIKKGLEAGFFRYLTKPINVSEFMKAMEAALEAATKKQRKRINGTSLFE